MKRTLSLSLNPSYYCNFRCDFCYLTTEQLGDKRRLGLDVLEKRLKEVTTNYHVDTVDLYGGEPLLLPEEYAKELIALLRYYGIDDIGINTNLSVLPDWIMDDPELYISVSYDFEAREKNQKVLENMLKLNREFSVLMLGSPKLLNTPIEEVIRTFNVLSHLQSIEVKPYSSNQANRLDIDYFDYEEFVKSLIASPIEKSFDITNQYQIEEALKRERNAFSDDHLYITPTGKYAVLDFDANDDEFFLELSSLDEYETWCQKERERVSGNLFCGECPYYGHCLSEHLRPVRSLDKSCNGFYWLLKWAEGQRGVLINV